MLLTSGKDSKARLEVLRANRASRCYRRGLSVEALEPRILLDHKGLCPDAPHCPNGGGDGGDTITITLVDKFDPFPGGTYGDVWGEGNFAYIGTWQGSSGVGIIDISKSPLELAAHYALGVPGFKDVKVQNGIGYFATEAGDGAVHIVDLFDDSGVLSPTPLSTDDIPEAHNVFIDGTFLYLNHGEIWDVMTPSSPSLKWTFEGGHDITVLNGRLYVSDFSGFTRIYDVNDVANQAPLLLGSFESGNKTHSNWATADGKFLVVAHECKSCDVDIYNIAEPNNVQLVSTLTLQGGIPHNPLIVGNLLYISWLKKGLQVYDITVPANPVNVGSFTDMSTGGGARGFGGNWGVYPFLGQDKVLLSNIDDGLIVVDASSLLAPLRVVGPLGSEVSSEMLSPAILGPIVNEAISLWQAAGVDSYQLSNVDVRVADLSGSLLGLASSSGIAWIDRNAAGHGWFIDVSRESGAANRPAGSGVDLLSAVTHELGHVLGFDHDAMGVDDTLSVGTRIIPKFVPQAGDDKIARYENRLAGDVDDDGEVAFADYLALANNFGSTEAVWEDGDLDGNGKVEFADFLILSANFGSTRPQVVAPISSEESQFENVPAVKPSDADELFERFDDELSLDNLL